MNVGQKARAVAGDYITSVGSLGAAKQETVLKFRTLIIGALFFAHFSAQTSAAENVLFVGNSFTYYNNSVHKHYRSLRNASSEEGSASGDARMLTISGGSLAEHEGGLRQMLGGGDWDAVILQGYSNGPITPGKAERFQEAARDYAMAIRQNGAEPIFFMTWAYTGQPQMTAELDAAYSAIGAELNAKVVPVGLAFERALSLRPELTLIIDDGKHPTMAGTYLAACTFYAALHGESPEGLDYDAGLAVSDAALLQQVAWEIWQAYEAR